MPRKPFSAKVTRVYEPDFEAQLKGLKIAVDYARRLKAGVINDNGTKKSS
ncbi:hypothetical protein [Sporomusa sphaeroides]|nr:hypothetical protein [Sporomusa sphaeroides]MCM0757413.1 hypothetical protein [Sporomusa sphaeroides DSM 2875]HML33807.1 hypothetical protein [Sporomusa sphaeroides]